MTGRPSRQESRQKVCGIRLRADPADLPSLLEWVRSRLDQLGLEGRTAMVLELAAEELGLNAMTHGRPTQGEGLVELSIEGVSEGEVRLTVLDDGEAFDPTALVAPDTDAPLEERRVGGLGVHLVRQMADGVTYERRDGRNVTEVVVRLQEGAAD